MRFILRKYVDADTAAEALRLDKKTPVHDVYLKEGEEPKRGAPKDLIGFTAPLDDEWREDEAIAKNSDS